MSMNFKQRALNVAIVAMVALLGAGTAGDVLAASAKGSLKVSATVVAVCIITTTSPVAGSQGLVVGDRSVQGDLAPIALSQCGTRSAPTITLDADRNIMATGQRESITAAHANTVFATVTF